MHDIEFIPRFSIEAPPPPTDYRWVFFFIGVVWGVVAGILLMWVH